MFKKISILALLILAIFFLTSCNKKHNPVQISNDGEIPISMNLTPAYEQGYEVTKVSVYIHNSVYQDSLNLLLKPEEQSAQGIFYDLAPGSYTINVKVFSNTLLIATGLGQGQVIPGHNSLVHISLHLVTGDLSIIVDWDDLFPQIPKKLLFIGNSYTYANEGLWECVRLMTISAHPEWNIVCGHVANGGYTLEDHSLNPETLNAINSGFYDLIILQEQSTRPIDNPDLFYRAATALDSLIKQNNAKTALYMTHARRDFPEMINELSNAYTQIGNQLNALVCPAGLAWEKSRETDPLFNLYENDGSHPNYRGSYLNACVIYASIYKENPLGNSHTCYPYLSENEKLYLQNIAWLTACEYFGWESK